MRFKDFLAESDLGNFDMEKFLIDCAPYLAEIKGVDSTDLLKHGTKSGPDVWGIKKHQRRLAPRDSDIKLHTAINDFFEEKFDWIARTDAIFATSHRQDALGYGIVYFIFPVGKFKYLWSPDIDDLWGKTCKTRGEVKRRNPGISYDEAREKAICLTIDTVKNATWHFNTDLKKAMALFNEVMLKSLSEQYYLIRAGTDFSEAFMKQLQQRGIIREVITS